MSAVLAGFVTGHKLGLSVRKSHLRKCLDKLDYRHVCRAFS